MGRGVVGWQLADACCARTLDKSDKDHYLPHTSVEENIEIEHTRPLTLVAGVPIISRIAFEEFVVVCSGKAVLQF